MNQDYGRCLKSLIWEHVHPHKSIKKDVKRKISCLKQGFIQYWKTLHRLQDHCRFQHKICHFSLRNVIWDPQVLTCCPVMTVFGEVWLSPAHSALQAQTHFCMVQVAWSSCSFFHSEPVFQVSTLDTVKSSSIMNLTPPSYWFHNYFCEAMHNVIQDSKKKKEKRKHLGIKLAKWLICW